MKSTSRSPAWLFTPPLDLLPPAAKRRSPRIGHRHGYRYKIETLQSESRRAKFIIGMSMLERSPNEEKSTIGSQASGE
jgi:hypothetical protein